MNDWCDKLKAILEHAFSMPFDVSQSIVDGEDHYTCCPRNEGNSFFSVQVYLHNQIRILVTIEPQKYGREILNEMALADEEKKTCFFNYLALLQDIGAKVQFKVNDSILEHNTEWPSMWRSFSCKINKVPIEINSQNDAFVLISEWMQHGVCLILSLLTVSDIEDVNDVGVVEGEGIKHVSLSTRYERNPINRKICLYKKGYSCAVCGIKLSDKYGVIGRNYIEVHHTTPVSVMGEGYILDIEKDLVPLCPNCHAMIHRKNPPYSVNELKYFVEDLNYGVVSMAAESPVEYNSPSNVIVGVVKKESIERFETRKANLYYFGKSFPSKYNIKNIQFFAPYYEGGIRGYYDVIAVRTARKSEIIANNDRQDDDHRIVLDLGDYHKLTDTPIKIKLANYTYAFIPLTELEGRNNGRTGI